MNHRTWMAIVAMTTFLVTPRIAACDVPTHVAGHPRLYFTAADLPRLRGLKDRGVHATIWSNLRRSADWCSQQKPRSAWIATETDDPHYENLYDRFYAAMHDMAIVEHLAFASVLSDPTDDPYFESARNWALACATVWRHEATNQPDASKAYAVLRIMKALAVSYDLLYPRLSPDQRKQIRETLVAVCKEYATFFQQPATAGEGYNKHHGSVDAAPFGVVALTLLGEVPQATDWLDLIVRKHTDYLLPHALTPSGTQEQSSNFWASTLQYRIFFIDALRRVTGRDLLAEFPDSLPGRIALAAVAGQQPSDLRYNENNRSVLFGPSYGQIDYWSPVLIYLARHHRRPIYQYLALWDRSLGSLQRTRYITPHRGEELLFSFGGYAYLWYDPTVPADVELDLPRSFQFPEPEVNEAYLRASYRPGDLVVAMKKGGLVVHAGGRPVLVDRLNVSDVNRPASAVEEMLVADDGRQALIRCVGPDSAGIGEQRILLDRPSSLTITRHTDRDMSWWSTGKAVRHGNRLTWPDGTRLEVTRGTLLSVVEDGFVESKVHYGGMKFADPRPMNYRVITVQPHEGQIVISLRRPAVE
ncbi:MAG: hypothetical protein ACC645_15710 [Pirellulales bacterium]